MHKPPGKCMSMSERAGLYRGFRVAEAENGK